MHYTKHFMAKRRWKCPQGCKLTKDPCPHLEALLDVGPKNSVALRYMDVGAMEGIAARLTFDWKPKAVTDEQRASFVALLEKHLTGRDKNEAIELLIARFVENMTISEIAAEQGYTSKRTAGYYLRKLLRQLRSQMKEPK